MTHLALVVVRAGYGPVSFLELFWLLVGLACLKDSACLLWDARAQLAAALAPPVDETLKTLAIMDHRSAWLAVLVQLCFIGVGVVAALRPPPPMPKDGDDALAEIATVALFLIAQVMTAFGARDRRRYSTRVDRDIQDAMRVERMIGGRRAYDIRLDEPAP